MPLQKVKNIKYKDEENRIDEYLLYKIQLKEDQTRAKVYQIASEIDNLLMTMLQNYTVEDLLAPPKDSQRKKIETIAEGDESAESDVEEEPEGFDLMGGLKIQQQIQQRRQNKSQQVHNKSTQKKSTQQQEQHPRISQISKIQEMNQPQEESLQSQIIAMNQDSSAINENNKSDGKQYFEASPQTSFIKDEDPQVEEQVDLKGSFKDQLQEQLHYYHAQQQELRKSQEYPSEKNQLESINEEYVAPIPEEPVFTKQICKSDDLNSKLNQRYQSIKQSLSSNFTNQMPLIQQQENPTIQEQSYDKEWNEDDQLQNSEVESLQQIQKPYKPIQEARQSLIGTLFTAEVLKEMRQLNEDQLDLPHQYLLPQQQTEYDNKQKERKLFSPNYTVEYSTNQCLKHLNKLKKQGCFKPKLNDKVNENYEKIWKDNGTRYQSSKSSEILKQQQMNEIFEKYGVDFRSWEINLKLQEDELKKIQRAEQDIEWKDKRIVKQINKLTGQKENAEILETNLENVLIFVNFYQYYLNQAEKEQNQQVKGLLFQQKQQEKIQIAKLVKEQKKEKEKEIIEHEKYQIVTLILQNYKPQQERLLLNEMKHQKDSIRKKQVLHQEKEEIVEKRSKKLEDKQVEMEQKQEEQVWQKAQQLLLRQKSLLRQKQEILKRINTNKV